MKKMNFEVIFVFLASICWMTVCGKALEDSSVDAVREITELIEAQRGYELNAKVITAADQMLGATTQIR